MICWSFKEWTTNQKSTSSETAYGVETHRVISRSLRENHSPLPCSADLSRSQMYEMEEVIHVQFSLRECSSSTKPCRVRATVEDKTITVARLSRRIVESVLSGADCPQIHVSLDLNPQHVSIILEADGNTQVDVMGYVHDVDVNSLMALKRQLGETSEKPSETNKQETELSFEPFDTTVCYLFPSFPRTF